MLNEAGNIIRLRAQSVGLIKQGFVEFSNVNLSLEVAHLFTAKHMYDATLQALQLAEKMQESDHLIEK